jgi:hypothetical protein
MAELEKVSYPKPCADFIYDTFNEFVARHPWVARESIRPKSIVRDMVERFAVFNDYVKEFALARSEGVLLRYLVQAYKMLVQTIPDAAKTDELHDIIAYARVMVAQVDNSLLQEWERMLHPPEVVAAGRRDPPEAPRRGPQGVRRPRPRRAAHPRAGPRPARMGRRRRRRARCPGRPVDPRPHRGRDGRLLPAEYPELRWDHEARFPKFTLLTATGDRVWRVRQVMVDPEGDNAWALEGDIDLRDDPVPRGPAGHPANDRRL